MTLTNNDRSLLLIDMEMSLCQECHLLYSTLHDKTFERDLHSDMVTSGDL